MTGRKQWNNGKRKFSSQIMLAEPVTTNHGSSGVDGI